LNNFKNTTISWQKNEVNRQTVVLFQEVKDFILNNVSKKDGNYIEFPIYGSIIDNSVYHIRSTKLVSINNHKLSSLGKIRHSGSELFFELPHKLKLTITLEQLLKEKLLKFPTKVNNHVYEIIVIIIDDSSFYLRIDNPDYPLGLINKKSIGVIGLGSGGSLISTYLAKSGIGKLTLIDGDILLEHNIIRHVCAIYDIGRYKTLAVRDYILRRIPNLKIITAERDFSINDKYEEDYYKELLSSVDLIVSAVGDHVMNSRINSFAYKNKIPVIYAGAFDRITGGIMIRVDPLKKSICYDCIYSKNPDVEHTEVTDKVIFYGRNAEDMLAQPGLGIDIDLITLPAVKLILSTLLGDKEESGSFTHDIYYWYNKNLPDRQIETFVLYEERRTLNRRPECGICPKITT
jgi:molybdopterin/thiamine biosynthesis adenylyltransferase